MTLQYKIQDFQKSKVFCPAPFVHFYVHSTERPKPVATHTIIIYGKKKELLEVLEMNGKVIIILT